MMVIEFYKCRPSAITPTRAHNTDAGWDFFSAVGETIIRPGEVVTIPTGIVMANHMGSFVWDKSGRGSAGLKTLGGVIDQPYVGEIGIIVVNVNLWPIISLLMEEERPGHFGFWDAVKRATVTIPANKAISQMVWVDPPNSFVELSEEAFKVKYYDRFDASNRGVKGFGSSDQKRLTPQVSDLMKSKLTPTSQINEYQGHNGPTPQINEAQKMSKEKTMGDEGVTT